MTPQQLKELSELFLAREAELEIGRATSDDVVAMRHEINRLFKKYNLEYCAHNAALLGSKRYAKYKFKDYDGFVNHKTYVKLRDAELN